MLLKLLFMRLLKPSHSHKNSRKYFGAVSFYKGYTVITECGMTFIHHKRLNAGKKMVVETYESVSEAEIGHEKWMKYISVEPKVFMVGEKIIIMREEEK